MASLAPAGDMSALLRLEPLVNDIAAQLSDNFKQSITKRLLPEACKLLGPRVAAGPTSAGSTATAQSPWGPPQSPAALSLGGSTYSGPNLTPAGQEPCLPAHSGYPQHHLENDLAGFAPGTGQPLRPDQGPPHDAASAAAASLLGGHMGPPAPASSPPDAGAGGGLVTHPPESRFAFANAADMRRTAWVASAPGVGGGAADPGTLVDPLLFLGLGPDDGGPEPPTSAADAAAPFLLAPGGGPLAGAGRLDNAAAAAAAAGFSVHGSGRQPSQMGVGTPPPQAAATGAGTAASSPDLPYITSHVRPGSSLDPGVAGPPVSLPGTEPLRGVGHPHHQPHPGPSQQQQQQQGRQLVQQPKQQQQQEAAAAMAPMPLFGGAPGPSPGGAGSHQQGLRQRQQQQPGTAASGEAFPLTQQHTNGDTYHIQMQQMQQQQQQQQQQRMQYLQPYGPEHTALHQAAQQQQAQQQQALQHQVALQQQALQQQQQAQAQQQQAAQQQRQAQGQAQQQRLVRISNGGPLHGPTGPDPNGAGLGAYLSGGPPRGSLDGRFTDGNLYDMPYDMQMLYSTAMGAEAQQLHHYQHNHGFTLGPGLDSQQAEGFGGGSLLRDRGGAAAPAAAPDYGMYGMMAAAGGGGAGGELRSASMSSAGSGFGLREGALMLQAGLASPPPGMAGGQHAGGRPLGPASGPSPPGASGRLSRGGGPAVDSHEASFLAASAGRSGGGVAMPSPPVSDASGPSSSSSAAAMAGAGKAGPTMSMAAKLQQVASKPTPQGPSSPVGGGGASGKGRQSGSGSGSGGKPPADMPGRFRCLPPSVQSRIHALTRDNHVVLVKDFDEKVLSKMTLLVDKFGAGECLAMLDRIEEVLKGKAGRLANGPGYLDVSVSTRLDELKQRASGQVTAPEDYARSTLHSRIYAELRDLIARHGFLQWHHFDQGIINMLKKMPNATALERLSELAYHSFKNVDNPKSCIVSIFTTKPKYQPTGNA